MSDAAITLGPFVLQRPIGAGGMGEVWQGVHAEEHVPVAVKVIGAHWARHAGLRRAFQREVRAVAGLSHPAIVAVFDDGVVDAGASAASGGRLAEGSPYLAMEYLPRGNLEALLPALDWPLVQVVTSGTLAALAHAHARGVIHCDLKPGNVLLSGWSEVAIKLTDFGVAHALGPAEEEEGEGGATSAGTPAYMAPEQLLGRTRDFGPWTDLYALGCTIWEMCCGRPPFLAPDLPRLAGMHLYEAPGPFRPVFSVPSEVEPWLRRLLAKRPHDRFARAADALAGLRRAAGAAEAAIAWSTVAARREAATQGSPTRPGHAAATTPEPTRRPHARTPLTPVEGLAGGATAPAGAIDLARLSRRQDRLSRGAGEGADAAARAEGRSGADGEAGERGGADQSDLAGRSGGIGEGAALATGPTLLSGAAEVPEVGKLRASPAGGELGSAATQVAVSSADARARSGSAATQVAVSSADAGAGRAADAGAAGVSATSSGDASAVSGSAATQMAARPADTSAALAATAWVGAEPTPAAPADAFMGTILAARPIAAQVREDRAGETGRSGQERARPFPATWRQPHDAAAARPLHGTGLGLVRVRELPLVGREAERDRLWQALARAAAEGRPRLVLVRGASGVGKSRLVEWTAARAHELGAAEVLRAVHGPFGGPAEGLPRMLALHLRTVGLDGDGTFARCLAALAPDEVDAGQRLAAAALTELLCPGQDGPGRPVVRLHEARERHLVIADYLARVGAERPALVWIDDAQWASGALELVRFCLRRAEPGPRALFVATIRDDLLAERPAESQLVAELAALPGCESMSLMPLPEDQHHALVEELLGLERGLVDAIVARTGGNPLFSVQLVGDWIARGLLRPGQGGFALREGAEIDLPDDLHALWRRRVEGLLARAYPGAAREPARAALELAAAIGQEIDATAWALACELEGIAAPPDLALVLVRERLAAATPAGFAFVHGMLRESLDRLAEEAGRAALHHRTCAAMLRRSDFARVPGRVEQVARHLIAAGDLAEALAPLLEWSYQLQLAGQYQRAEAALREHAALMDRLGLEPRALDRLRGRMQAAWLAWMRGGEGGGARGAAEVEAIAALAREGGHDEVLGEAMRWRGLVARFERRFPESLAALAEAAACFARTGDAEGQARTALAQAVTLRVLGQTDEAEARLAEAERLARARGLAVLLPRVLGNLAEIALQRADWPEAQVRFARALEAAEAVGDRKAVALTSGGAGDLAFVVGDHEGAEAHYRRAETLFAALGSRYLAGIRIHLAALDLVRGRPGAVAALRAAAGASDPLHAALARLALAGVAADAGAMGGHLAAAEDLLARAGEARRVLVRLAELAAEAAARRGWAEASRRAAALARALAARLDAGDEPG